MFRRAIFVLMSALLLTGAFAVYSSAQTTLPIVEPDAGVKGSGVIAVNNTTLGAFDINVARFGSRLAGGFRYGEITPTAMRAEHDLLADDSGPAGDGQPRRHPGDRLLAEHALGPDR